jgi:hypothetical protein
MPSLRKQKERVPVLSQSLESIDCWDEVNSHRQSRDEPPINQQILPVAMTVITSKQRDKYVMLHCHTVPFAQRKNS